MSCCWVCPINYVAVALIILGMLNCGQAVVDVDYGDGDCADDRVGDYDGCDADGDDCSGDGFPGIQILEFKRLAIK